MGVFVVPCQVRKLALLLTSLALVACEKPPPPLAALPAQAQKPDAEPKSQTSSDTYELEVNAPASLGEQETGELVISFSARPGYKINAEYPHAFRPQASPGLQFDAPRFDLGSGSKTPCGGKPEDTCRIETRVPFKTGPKGERTAAGVVAFSVCNETLCLIEKIPVTAPVKVN